MTMNDSRPASGGLANVRRNRLGWPRVLVRMLLIVLPGQLLGYFIADTVLTMSGVLRDRPYLGDLILVLGGFVAGLGLGLLLRPERDRLLGFALVGAAMGAAGYVLLRALAQLRAPALTPGPSFGDFLSGALIVAAVQSAVAIPLWWARRSVREVQGRPTAR
jgi:hypothetical protein